MLTKNQITALTATKAKTAFTAPLGEVTAIGPTLSVSLHQRYEVTTYGKVDAKALCSGLIVMIDESEPPKTHAGFGGCQTKQLPPLPCVDCCSTDVTRLALNGIYTDGKGYCATDGHRLVTSLASVEQGWILPAEFVKLAHKLKAKGYLVNGQEACFHFDGGVVIARLIEGPYPRYQNVLPHKFEHSTAIPEAKVWDEAAKKLKALGSKTFGVDSNGFALGKDYRHIKVMEPWHNEAWSNIMAFNAKYMAQLLKGVANPTLQSNGPLGACVIKTEGEIRLIMPLRIMD